MTVSAFGVSHSEEIAKKSKGQMALRLRGLTEQGVAALGRATRSVASDTSTHGKTLRESGKEILNRAGNETPYGGAIESAKKVATRRKEAAAAGRSTAVLDNATVGDVVRAAGVKRTTETPAGLLKGKQTTTSYSNALTGQNKTEIKREGSTFFKPKHVVKENGETTAIGEAKGGLTGKGKVALVGGPAAATGLGGIALNERSKRKNGYVY